MIRYDRTPFATTVYCTCGWRELCLTREGAWRVAEMHERGWHPDRRQVRDAAGVRRRRDDTTSSHDVTGGSECSDPPRP